MTGAQPGRRCCLRLRGFHGSPPLEVAVVAQIVVRLGALLLARPSIRKGDLNPVSIHPAEGGAVARDALMVAAEQPPNAVLHWLM